MAKKAAGEVSLKTPSGPVTLRLDIGTMMDLEDHFGVGGALILAERLTKLKMKDSAILYLAMTGGDWQDKEAITEAATTIRNIGFNAAIEGISECLARTLMPEEGEPGKPQRASKQ